MTSTDVDERNLFRKSRRPANLRLNCKLDLPDSFENNVVPFSPTNFPEKAVEESTLPEKNVTANPGYGWRHVQFLLMFGAVFGLFLHRTSVAVVIVAMTTQIRPDQEVFDWTHEQQGAILGSFLWGYAATHIPAGYLTTRFGAKLLLGLCVFFSSILTLCTPAICRQYGWVGFTVLRVVSGCIQGMTFPGTFTLLGKWAVPEERSRASTFTTAAQSCGIFASMALSGVIAVNAGWESVYYIFGSVTLIFAILWFAFSADSPGNHRYISEKERNFISQAIGKESKTPEGSTPWRRILSSPPFLGILATHVGAAWNLWFFLAALPRYTNDVFEYSISLNGVVSGGPFLFTALVAMTSGWISDILIKNGKVSTLFSRKFFNTIATWVPALIYIALNLTPNEYKGVQIAEIMIAIGLVGGVYSGYMVNFVDISPRFSGLLVAISNCISSLLSALAPPTVGVLVDSLGDVKGWETAFYLTAGISFFTNLLYIIYASSNVQPWNDDSKMNSDDRDAQNSVPTGIQNQTFSVD